MRTTIIVALLGVVHAAYDQCDRPVGQWAGVNQADGNGYLYAGKYHAGSVFFAGYQDGDYAFHSNHILNGATGSHGDNPDAVTTVHATGTHSDPDPDTGVSAPAASSQNGRDAVVTKISEAGVFEGIFAVDTMSVDGKYDDTSLNSGWGGYSWFNDLDSFAASGDNDNMVAMGLFRGKLTFPTAAGAAPVTLENPKWQKYDGFLAKFNVNTHKVVWATGDKIQMPTCNTNTDGTPMKPKNKETGEGCDEPTSVPGSVSTTSEGHIIATSSYGNSGRSTTNGRILLFNGNTGANVWSKDLGQGNFMYGTETIGTKAFVAGTIDGTEIDPFKTGVKKNYTDAPAIVAVDASAAGSGAFQWSVTFGQEGTATSIVADPDGTHLYVGGSLDQAPETGSGKYTIGSACSLTGKYGGFLMKLAAATGECVWATDTPSIGSASTRFGMRDHGLDVDATGTYIYTVKYDDDPVVFDDSHTIPNRGLNSDGFLAKYSCADGVGQWVESIGGGGSDYIREVVTTPNGVVVAGATTSQSIKLGDAEIVNLQHKRADGVATAKAGQNAHFAMMIHEEKTISCIQTCTADTTTAVLKDNFCLIGSTCIANDDFYEYKPCFQCRSAISKSDLQGPVKTNHCYIDKACRARGEARETYARYGSNSVCETCDPDRDPDSWSLEVGYFHDRDTADQRNSGANDYGMYFTSRSNGCQLLPDMPTPSTPSAGLTAANARPTVSTVAGIGTRTTSAISAVNSAAQGNQGAEIAWGWYHADSADCAKDAGKDVCKHTPSELSDTIAPDFETNLYYDHSVARVKVQQALAILQSDLATPSADRSIDDIKKDIVAHMLIPHYQGAIKAAHQMDEGTAIKDTDGAEHWKVIDAAVGSFAASDRAQLAAMFATDASGKMNFCTVQTLLLRNLPGSSNLQYGSKDCIKEKCKEIGTHTPNDGDAQHVTARDIGVLKASLQADGTAKDCASAGALAMPPPSPPPAPVDAQTSPVESPDSGLTDGEMAGVAVGAAVGGIVLLGGVALILRSLLAKDAKPVFTCLEKSNANSELEKGNAKPPA